MSSKGAFDLLIDELRPVRLDAIDTASTFRRFDHKFLLDDRQVRHLVDSLGLGWSVLEVDGRRESSVSSVYFDTDDLFTYRAHVQGRRRRFKVRTRHYGDPSATWLEVKLKGVRGQTIKQRIPHPAGDPMLLEGDGLTYVESALSNAYGIRLPATMSPSITTAYRRTTLIDVVTGDRVTIDRQLQVGEPAGTRAVSLGECAAIVETKSIALRSQVERVMIGVGARPQRLSKYCMGVVTLHVGIAGNRWRPQLRQLAGGAPALLRGGARPRVG